ncbi:MAG: TolC family protein [Candidatus Sedimenticola sp. (ex Thyasira tokunagai)]
MRQPKIMLYLLLFVVAYWGNAQGEETMGLEPLPEPLTLPYALSLADDSHPELETRRARMEAGDAQQLEITAKTQFQAGLEAKFLAVKPSYLSSNRSINNSSVKLRLSKQLYDAGRNKLELEATSYDRKGREWDYLDARQKRRLDIMTRYFDVLLSDMRYLRDDEVMTVAFLRWNKLRDVTELGRVSDLDLLERESIFNRELRQRTLSRHLQQATRSRLAMSINRPESLSAELERPSLPSVDRALGEVDDLVVDVLASNPRLKSLRAGVLAAVARVDSAKAGDGLVIRGEMELAGYNRTTGSSHPLSAGLVMELPLSSGGAVDAAVAKQRALLHEQRALLAQGEMDLRQTALDLWLEISALKVEQQEVEALGAYRELYLDRSRALYEHELKSNLGDAASKTVDYQLRRDEVEFNLVLAWARLDALGGRLLQLATGKNNGEKTDD